MTETPDSREHPELITTQELADILRVPISTIYQWNHKGLGPKRIQIGKHVRYDVDDVQEWVDSKRIDNTQKRKDDV